MRARNARGRIARISALIAVGLIATLLAACGASDKTKAVLTAPRAPMNLSVETTEQGLRVSWDPVPGATSYTLFVGYDEREYEHMIEVKGTEVTIKGLKTGTRYVLAATGWNEAGESDLSPESSAVYFAKRKHRDTQVAQRGDPSRRSR